jgi:hypothetical protein
VTAPDGTVYFIRVSGDSSKTRAPKFALWKFAAGHASKVRSLDGEMYLAGMADDRLVWNAPSRACGDWGLFLEEADGLSEIGCGAVMVDPVSVPDPDLLVEDDHEGGEETVMEAEGLTDLVIVVGDFSSSGAAQAVADGLDRPARVISHGNAPMSVRPGAWGVVVRIASGVPVDEDLGNVRAQLKGCDCGAWLAPNV